MLVTPSAQASAVARRLSHQSTSDKYIVWEEVQVSSSQTCKYFVRHTMKELLVLLAGVCKLAPRHVLRKLLYVSCLCRCNLVLNGYLKQVNQIAVCFLPLQMQPSAKWLLEASEGRNTLESQVHLCCCCCVDCSPPYAQGPAWSCLARGRCHRTGQCCDQN